MLVSACEDLAVQVQDARWPSAESSVVLSACLPLPCLWQSQNLVNVRHTMSTSCSGSHVMQRHPLSAIIFIFTIILVLGAKWISCPVMLPFGAPEIQNLFLFNIWTKHKNMPDTRQWAGVFLYPSCHENAESYHTFASLAEVRLATDHIWRQ